MDDYDFEEDGDSVESQVEREFWQLAGALMAPHHNECLVCFLLRAVSVLEPTGFAMTQVFRDANAPRATGLDARLERLGVHGDAHLLRWGVVANGMIWMDERCVDCGMPTEAPPCFGVRKGSTQPCGLWIWRRQATQVMAGDWLEPTF